MKSHLDQISKLMEDIQLNTDCIDDEVERCEKIICSSFDQISACLETRKNALIKELKKTAKRKKLAVLVQHNQLKNKNAENENEQNIVSINFDLHFNGNHNKQLIQMINHFGSISANPRPNLLSLKNKGNNFTVCVEWQLPSSYIANIDLTKVQKVRIEWSRTNEIKWNCKEFVIRDDEKKQLVDHKVHLLNVGQNGTYIVRLSHYYNTKWSKNSNTKSIAINGIYFDVWDAHKHGNNVQIEGKCVHKCHTSGYESAFLSNLAIHGIHHWQFRIEAGHKNASSKRIFGIWRVNDESVQMIDAVLDTYFTNEEIVDLNVGQVYGKAFGNANIHQKGDTIDMFLDLNNFKLFYKRNNAMYGKPIVVKEGRYRAVVSFYYCDDKIRLLGYRAYLIR